jgi:hypothetical protein
MVREEKLKTKEGDGTNIHKNYERMGKQGKGLQSISRESVLPFLCLALFGLNEKSWLFFSFLWRKNGWCWSGRKLGGPL